MDDELRAELISRFTADQDALAKSLKISARLNWAPIRDELLTDAERADLAHTRELQRDNVGRLREIIEAFGWPHRELVGEDGAEAAWLLAQHADSDAELQRRCAQLITQAHSEGLVTSEHFASLTDRVALANGQPQIYATQLEVRDGEWVVRMPCDVPTAIRLRAELGLETIEAAIDALKRQVDAF